MPIARTAKPRVIMVRTGTARRATAGLLVDRASPLDIPTTSRESVDRLQNSPKQEPKGNRLICFIPFFTAAEWDVVLGAWDGPPEKLPYAEHRALQGKAAGDLRKRGIEVREIRMDPHKMLSWQRKNKCQNDPEGRSAYYIEAGRCWDLGMPAPA